MKEHQHEQEWQKPQLHKIQQYKRGWQKPELRNLTETIRSGSSVNTGEGTGYSPVST